MYNYLCADMKRLARRFPRWLLVLLALGALAIFVVIMGQVGLYGRWSSFTYLTTFKTMILPLSLIVGLSEIIFVFGDDIKAKTMQASVGAGLPRWGLVTCKFIETCAFSFVDIVFYGVLTVLFGYVFQAPLSGEQLQEVSVYLFVEWLKVIGYTSLTMILIFFKRSLALSVLLYIALFARVIDKVVGFIITRGPMESLHLDRYTMSAFLNTLRTFLIGGASGLKPFLAVLAYILFGCLVTMLLFRKRELEF